MRRYIIVLLSMLAICSVPCQSQTIDRALFERMVAITKHFEGWHDPKTTPGYVGYGHQLRGTPYDIPAEGTILFIEDVGERPHAVERMIYNLKLGGILEKLSGLIIGQFTEYEENKSLGKELYGAIADLVKEYDYPVCFNFPVGHVSMNLPMINGAEVRWRPEERK